MGKVDHVFISGIMTTMCFLGKFRDLWKDNSKKTNKDCPTFHMIFATSNTNREEVERELLGEMLVWEFTRHSYEQLKQTVHFHHLSTSIHGMHCIAISLRLPFYFLKQGGDSKSIFAVEVTEEELAVGKHNHSHDEGGHDDGHGKEHGHKKDKNKSLTHEHQKAPRKKSRLFSIDSLPGDSPNKGITNMFFKFLC